MFRGQSGKRGKEALNCALRGYSTQTTTQGTNRGRTHDHHGEAKDGGINKTGTGGHVRTMRVHRANPNPPYPKACRFKAKRSKRKANINPNDGSQTAQNPSRLP